MTETAGSQQGRFKKGQSGNPAGRPKGCRHKSTMAAEALLDGEAGALTRKCILLAKGGDMTAMRLCVERLIPPRRDRPVAFALPAITRPEDAVRAMTAVLAAVASGDLTPAEGATVAGLVDQFIRATDATELERRISHLEGRA